LNVYDHVEELLSELSSSLLLVNRNLIGLSFIDEGLYRANNGCSTCTEGLIDSSFLASLHDLLDLKGPL
jgi:hypothetical protein